MARSTSSAPPMIGAAWSTLPARLRLGSCLTAGFVAVGLVSCVWTPDSPTKMHILLKLRPPFAAGLLGTDAFGRDILSQLMTGAGNSLTTAILAVLLGLGLGTALGTLAAAARGWTEEVVMRLADVIFAFPALMSAIMIAAVLGPGQSTAIVAIGLFAVPVFTRVARAAAARIWTLDYCLAARGAGKGRLRITLDHVLPNIAGTLGVQATLQLGLALLVEAGLGFLGLGLPPPAPSWGRMLFDSQTYLARAPWLAIAPGCAVALAVLGFNLLGDGLRDFLDPRRTMQREGPSDARGRAR